MDEIIDKKPEKKRSRKILWIVVLILVISATAVLGYRAIDEATTIEYVDEAFNILVLGIDYNYGEGKAYDSAHARSDTIMLAMLPKDKKEATLVSIPRDTLVTINGRSNRRINSAYPEGGVELVKSTVEELMGITIDRYVVVDFDGFEALVDVIGGVEIDVDKNMRYTDEAGGLKIDIKKGLQVLDGEQALGYVRYRQDALGDISRVARQQNFIKAVAKKLLSWDGIKEYKAILDLIEEYAESDLSFKDLVAIGRKMIGFDFANINSYTLPGHFQDAYWAPDAADIKNLMDQLFYVEAMTE